ncbi:MAG: hypothetical protein WBW59_20710, partial [Pseudolabrys sp.]
TGFSHPLSLQSLSVDYPSLIPSQSGKWNGGILIERRANRKGQVAQCETDPALTTAFIERQKTPR